MRKILPIAAAVVCGFLTFTDFFVLHPQLDAIGSRLTEGVLILAAFGLIAGILNLLNVHIRRSFEAERGRGYHTVLILALLVTLIAGVASPRSQALSWIFTYLYYPLQSTMAALLAFFVVSAAYRVFRLRNGEAFIMLITSLVVLIAQIPFSKGFLPFLPLIRDWILDVPVTAGTRGIILGTALGTITTALRILLAVDRPYA